MFPSKFIVVSDIESNSLRHGSIKFKIQVWYTWKEMVLIKFGKSFVMQIFLSIFYPPSVNATLLRRQAHD